LTIHYWSRSGFESSTRTPPDFSPLFDFGGHDPGASSRQSGA